MYLNVSMFTSFMHLISVWVSPPFVSHPVSPKHPSPSTLPCLLYYSPCISLPSVSLPFDSLSNFILPLSPSLSLSHLNSVLAVNWKAGTRTPPDSSHERRRAGRAETSWPACHRPTRAVRRSGYRKAVSGIVNPFNYFLILRRGGGGRWVFVTGRRSPPPFIYVLRIQVEIIWTWNLPPSSPLG